MVFSPALHHQAPNRILRRAPLHNGTTIIDDERYERGIEEAGWAVGYGCDELYERDECDDGGGGETSDGACETEDGCTGGGGEAARE